jgi:LPS sulfotransferase NodH
MKENNALDALPPPFTGADVLLPPGDIGDAFRKLRLKYVIACTSRTGSTLLASELGIYGVFADEHLNAGHVLAAKERGVATLADYVRETIAAGADPTQWAVKGAFGAMEQLASLGELAHLREWKFIYLTRENLVQQAISLLIAQKSGRWSCWSRGGRFVVETEYDYAGIAAAVDMIVTANAQWECFFDAFAMKPLCVSYESLTGDLEGTLSRARKYLGLPDSPQAHQIEHRTAKMLKHPESAVEPRYGWWTPTSQKTELNRLWEERYRNDPRARAG